MPFTFSHPTYIVPLKYVSPQYTNMTGLILGSMAPDFEYFIMLEPYRSIGHSLSGLIFQVIPLCLIVAVLFHALVKESLVTHLPSILHLDRRAYRLLGSWKLSSIKEWVVFILSVIVGFLSHITVDAFTHAGGYFVLHISLLREMIFSSLPIYKILQYCSSIFGLLIAAGFVIYRLSKSSPDSVDRMPTVSKNRKILFWLSAILISIVVVFMKLLMTTSSNLLGILVVAPITGLCLGLLLTSIVVKIVGMRHRE